jgi:hypothetical protein
MAAAARLVHLVPRLLHRRTVDPASLPERPDVRGPPGGDAPASGFDPASAPVPEPGQGAREGQPGEGIRAGAGGTGRGQGDRLGDAGGRRGGGARHGGGWGGQDDGEDEPATRSVWRWLAGIIAATMTAIVTSWVLGWIQRVPGFRPPTPPPAASTTGPAQFPPPAGTGPVTVAVAQWQDSGCGAPDWIYLGDESEIDFRPGADPRDAWAGHPAVENALVASPTHVEATVQGRSETAVVLTGVEARVHRRRPVPAGTILSNTLCGYPGAFRSFQIDLDSRPPTISSRGDRDQRTGRELEPIRFPYVVSSSDPETFLINAVAEECDCEWSVELSWQSAGRTGTVVIDDDGRPFRTVSPARSHTMCFPDGTCIPYPLPGPPPVVDAGMGTGLAGRIDR